MSHKRGRPKGVAPLEAQRAPRCTGHSSRTGLPCKNPAVRGTNVCMTHGAAAPQVREAARRRLALLLDPALKCLYDLLMQRDNLSVALQAVKEVLERNQLYAVDVEAPHLKVAPSLRVNTQINTNVAAMTDAELDDYRHLLAELKRVLPAAPKVIEGIVML